MDFLQPAAGAGDGQAGNWRAFILAAEGSQKISKNRGYICIYICIYIYISTIYICTYIYIYIDTSSTAQGGGGSFRIGNL